MPEQPDELDEDGRRTLRRIARIHFANSLLFCFAAICIVGGVVIALIGFEWAATIFFFGFAIIAVLMLQRWLVYPFLRCPRCGKRVFMLEGRVGAVAPAIRMFQRSCGHCELPFSKAVARGNDSSK